MKHFFNKKAVAWGDIVKATIAIVLVLVIIGLILSNVLRPGEKISECRGVCKLDGCNVGVGEIQLYRGCVINNEFNDRAYCCLVSEKNDSSQGDVPLVFPDGDDPLDGRQESVVPFINLYRGRLLESASSFNLVHGESHTFSVEYAQGLGCKIEFLDVNTQNILEHDVIISPSSCGSFSVDLTRYDVSVEHVRDFIMHITLTNATGHEVLSSTRRAIII